MNKLIDNKKNNSKDDNDRNLVIKLSCRLILRISIALLLKYKHLNNSEIFDMDYLSNILLEIIKTIFEYLQNPEEKKSDFFNKETNDNDNKNDIKKKELLSFGDLGNVLNDFIFQNNIDLLLEFQSFLWINLPNFIHELINNDNDYDNKEKSVLLLLDVAIFSAGVLRSHSSDELHRRKLSHLNVITNISDGLVCIKNTTIILKNKMKIHDENVNNNNNNIINHNNNDNNQIIKKLSEIIIQSVVSVRNFSSDNNGKIQILKNKITPLLCYLLTPYKGYPELILNCTRVLSKLSLLDNFRFQINGKYDIIKCLINILISEGLNYSNINGNSNNEDSDHNNNSNNYGNNNENNGYKKNIWPYWHTWPIIARVAFTLGNLTTSNNSNRVIIGIDSDSLSSILMLLQVHKYIFICIHADTWSIR